MGNYSSENLIDVPASPSLSGSLAIKSGENFFIAGNVIISSGSSSSTNFYKCASVIPASSGGVIVSGAGSSSANGTYTLGDSSQTGENRVWYLNGDQSNFRIQYSGSWWVVTDGDGTYYETNEGVEDPWGVTWLTGARGDDPAPSVTESQAAEASWTGYIYDSTTQRFATTATSGLSYTTVTPVVGKVYTEDALVRIADIGMLDSYTQLLLQGCLTDDSPNAIAVTNNGLTFDGTKITLPQSGYASIAADVLPDDVLCDDKDWTFEIKFKCTDTTGIPSDDYSCLFGNGHYTDRFDILVSSSLIRTGTFGSNAITWTPDTSWHVYKVTHTSENVFSFDLDGTSGGTLSYSDFHVRDYSLDIGKDGEDTSVARFGYPFEISYVRISNCIR